MTTQRKISILDNGNLEIFIPAKFKKRDGRKIIIAPSEDADITDADAVPVSALARQLARAHAWLDTLDSGTHQNVLDMAGELNVDPSYIGRILRLVNLAPDIQEAIINGTAPDSLSFGKLRSTIPDDWQEQRKMFNFK